MGYRTHYILSVIGTQEVEDAVVEHDLFPDDFINTETLECDEACTWYRHTEDMVSLSRAFPEVMLMLQGEGDASEDLWVEYYMNGMSQYASAKITYDEFDPEKLEVYHG